MKSTQDISYILKTYYDEESKLVSGILDETSFESEENLQRFSQWINFVHTKAEELNLSDDDLTDMGLNLTCHRDLYHLYLKRRIWSAFINSLSQFNGFIDVNSDWERA